MLGWYILVRKRTLGGAIGYSSGRNNSSLKTPSTCVLGRTANADAKNVNRRTLERTAIWALDGHIKIPQVVLMWGSRDSRRGVRHKTLCFLSCGGGGEGGLSTDVKEVWLESHTLIILCDHASVNMDIGGLVETHLGKRRSRHSANPNDDEHEQRVGQQFTRDGQIDFPRTLAGDSRPPV